MTNEEVHLLVEQLSMDYFQRPFLHQAYFNPRLKTTGGRYLLNSHNIELNYALYQYFGMNELKGIILHELCHYHLHIQGLGYKHGDADFKNLLKAVGAPRYCSTLPIDRKKPLPYKYMYQCQQCSLQYQRKRRVDLQKYRCGKCKGHLISIELGEEKS